MFVTIHGIDGTGKTTVAKSIPGAFRDEFPRAFCFDDLAMPAKEAINPTTAASGYQKSVLKKIGQSAVVRGILENGGLVSKDRWMIDVAAGNSFSDGREYTTNPAGVLVPDLAVLLTCEEDARMRRIQARENPTPDDLIPNVPGTRAHYFENFLRENMPAFSAASLVIDTTFMTPATVLEEIRGALPHDTRV